MTNDTRTTEAADSERDCNDCPILTNRRDFLYQAAAIAASFGITRSAAALPVTMVKALGRTNENVTYTLPLGDSVQIDRVNEIILARYQNVVYAFNLSCPHQRTALRWNERDKQFQCPKHHSKYDPKGDFISGRATRSMDRFEVKQKGATVVVDVDDMYKQDEDTDKWNKAFLRVAGSAGEK